MTGGEGRGQLPRPAAAAVMAVFAPARSLALALVLLAAVVVAGCGGGTPPPRDLSAACQVRPCRCIEESPSRFVRRQTVEVIWPERGPPSCPDGYRLEVLPAATR